MGYSSFQIGCIIVEYGLFNTTTLIPNLIYIRFGIIFTQFYINFSRQEHQIDVSFVSFKTCDSQVLAYTSFHFSFTVPLSMKQCYNLSLFSAHAIRALRSNQSSLNIIFIGLEMFVFFLNA